MKIRRFRRLNSCQPQIEDIEDSFGCVAVCMRFAVINMPASHGKSGNSMTSPVAELESSSRCSSTHRSAKEKTSITWKLDLECHALLPIGQVAFNSLLDLLVFVET